MAGYGTDEGFELWLEENGYTLPASAPTPAVLRNRGAGYTDGVYRARFSGLPTGGFDQERARPRTAAYAYCQPIVPDAAIKASYAGAYAGAVTPGSLSLVYTPAPPRACWRRSWCQ